MKHIYALLIKFLMVTVVLGIVLSLMTNLNINEILNISVAVTLISYVIGDLYVLSASNNTFATTIDVVLAIVTIYTFNYIWNIREISFADALVSAVVLGIGEWVFHKYVVRNVFPDSQKE